jgi:hypothetical protein
MTWWQRLWPRYNTRGEKITVAREAGLAAPRSFRLPSVAAHEIFRRDKGL